jgi:uncharacterized protein (DUF1330 family)
MAAYLIVDISVRDEQTYAGYRARVSDQIRQYGGEYLVRGGRVEQLEGDWKPKRMVVVRFESIAAAQKWWDSDDYAELKAIRQASTDTNMIVVEGVST